MTADVWGRCSLGRLADSFRDLPRPSQSFRILPQSFSELFRTFSESSFSSRVAFQVQPGDRLIMLEVTMATDPETDEACVRASVALAAEVEEERPLSARPAFEDDWDSFVSPSGPFRCLPTPFCSLRIPKLLKIPSDPSRFPSAPRRAARLRGRLALDLRRQARVARVRRRLP